VGGVFCPHHGRKLIGALAFYLALCGCSGEPVYLGVRDEPSCQDGCFTDPALESTTAARFDNAVAVSADEPKWVYPLEGAMLPTNLLDLTLQWQRGAASQSLFRIRVANSKHAFDLYAPCLNQGVDEPLGCAYHVPEQFWRTVALTLRGAEASIAVTALDESTRAIARSTPTAIAFSREDVSGGLYYWSSDLRGMFRLVFGARRAVPYISPRSEASPAACAGCHSVSRDGNVIAFSSGDAEDGDGIFQNAAFEGRLTVADVDQPETPAIATSRDQPSDSAMMALNRDGSRVVTAFDQRLVLRETSSGEILTEALPGAFGPGRTPFFPEYSPNDQELVVTLSDDPDSEIAVRNGGIFVIPVSDDGFGAAREVVAQDEQEFHFYPTWSPDGNWIAFVSAPIDGDSSHDRPDTRLRLVAATGGPIHELERASGSIGETATWPKFSPFEQCGGDGGCDSADRVFFVTFSSKRDYGLLLRNSKKESVERFSQLWLSAIDVGRLSQGLDASLAPVWLPQQALDTKNHLGFWTEQLKCNAEIGCGSGAICNDDGYCETVIK
jgi:TolB protein